jgi:hypothetical protein
LSISAPKISPSRTRSLPEPARQRPARSPFAAGLFGGLQGFDHGPAPPRRSDAEGSAAWRRNIAFKLATYVAVSQKRHFLGVGALQENVDEPHCGSGFSSADRHDEQCTAFPGLEGSGHSAYRFVLIGTIDDRFVNWRIFEWLLVFAAQPPQIIRRKKPAIGRGCA